MKHLNQTELSLRWSLKPHTLENMRWRKVGPPYIKIGGRILYRLEDIEAYEQSRTIIATAGAIVRPSH